MGEIIGKTNIKREKGYLYYVSFSKEGYLVIGKAILKRNGRPKINKGPEKIKGDKKE